MSADLTGAWRSACYVQPGWQICDANDEWHTVRRVLIMRSGRLEFHCDDNYDARANHHDELQTRNLREATTCNVHVGDGS